MVSCCLGSPLIKSGVTSLQFYPGHVFLKTPVHVLSLLSANDMLPSLWQASTMSRCCLFLLPVTLIFFLFRKTFHFKLKINKINYEHAWHYSVMNSYQLPRCYSYFDPKIRLVSTSCCYPSNLYPFLDHIMVFSPFKWNELLFYCVHGTIIEWHKPFSFCS